MLATIDQLMAVPGMTQSLPLDDALRGADAAIKSYCHRDFERQTYALLYLSGTGQRDLVLPERPVVSVGAVYEDLNGAWGQAAGAFPASSLLTAGIDYALVLDAPDGSCSRSGLLRRLRSSYGPAGYMGSSIPQATLAAGVGGPAWRRGAGTVKLVNVVAGYSPVPADLTAACLQLAALLARTMGTGGLVRQSESLGGYSCSLAVAQLGTHPDLHSTRGILAQYKAPVVV